MKKLFTYVLMLCASLSVSVAQQIQYPEPILNPESCTSIMVGKKASADGSVMTSHTCDSNYRTWMDIVPSASYDHDTTTTVYTGRMHTEYAEGTRGMIAKGTLPEAPHQHRILLSKNCPSQTKENYCQSTSYHNYFLLKKNNVITGKHLLYCLPSTAFFKHIICLPQTDGLFTLNRRSVFRN